MKSGIYSIKNKVNKKQYIGGSLDVHFRLSTHKGKLKRNSHRNKYLQSDWNKYGEKNFIFSIVCKCEQKCLANYENKIGNKYSFDNLYNIKKFGCGFSNKTTKAKPCYLFDLSYNKIKEFNTIKSAARFVGVNIDYKSINTYMIRKNKYRIYTKKYFDSNKCTILANIPVKEEKPYSKRYFYNQAARLVIYKVIKNNRVTVCYSFKEVGKFTNTSESTCRRVYKYIEFQEKYNFIIEKFTVLEALKCDWFIENNFYNKEKLLKLKNRVVEGC